MIHPLIKLLATQPELLAGHLGAYAELAGAEVSDVAGSVKRKLVLTLSMVASAALGLGLTAIALMMVAVVPVVQMPAPWLLVSVPVASWVAAGWCWWRLHQAHPIEAFGALREQMALDAAMLKQVQQS